MKNVIGLTISTITLIIGVVLIGEMDDLITGTATWETTAVTIVPTAFVFIGIIGLLVSGVSAYSSFGGKS